MSKYSSKYSKRTKPLRNSQYKNMLAKALKGQIFDAAAQQAAIVVEEYGRASFRFFVAALPVATGLLQHSAHVYFRGPDGRKEKLKTGIAHVITNSRGASAPILGWESTHWATRVAYQEEENPHAVTVKLNIKDKLWRNAKSSLLKQSRGRIGLTFVAGRSTHAEPETAAFIAWVNEKRKKAGKPLLDTTPRNVASINAGLILERNQNMRELLDIYISRAERNITRRVKEIKVKG